MAERIKLINRYGVHTSTLEKTEDSKYLWYVDGDGNYFRVSRDSSTDEIRFIDPDGGPMIYPGAKLHGEVDDGESITVKTKTVAVNSISEVKGKYIITIE